MPTATALFERHGTTRGRKLDRGVVGDRPASFPVLLRRGSELRLSE